MPAGGDFERSLKTKLFTVKHTQCEGVLSSWPVMHVNFLSETVMCDIHIPE
jgi:hypothetical protein